MRRVRTAVVAAVSAAVLAGCSSGETANETLPSSSSTAAETTEALPPLGPLDMPMPDEARLATADAAAEFIKYYIALINQAGKRMNATYLRQFSQDCSTCDRLADETEADSAAGRRYVGGSLTPRGEIKAALTTTGRAESAFLLDQETLTVVDAQGAAIPDLQFAALNNLSSGATVTWDDSLQSWRLNELTLG